MVAAEVLLLLQLPALVGLERVVVLPGHTDNMPVMAAGDALTIVDIVFRHPGLTV